MILTLEHAQKALAQAMEMCRKSFGGRPICVSLCDAQGFLLAFARMDGAPLRCINIARQKAYTTVRMLSSTAAFAQRLKNEGVQALDFCDPDLTSLAGGQLIKNAGGAICGGIGVSGLKAEEDDAIAMQVAASCLL